MTKMYSPLRYPGGKNKIYDKILAFMQTHNLLDKTYVEPFAGGFGLGVRLLYEKKVKSVIYNDADTHLYNLWYCILNRTDDLCNKLETVDVSIEERTKQKEIYKASNAEQLDDAFATLFLNRVNFSGVIKGGPIGGYSQSGKYLLDCRFRREDLITTIKKITLLKDNIQLYNMDAIEFLEQVVVRHPSKYFVNIDPPYVIKGSLLYTVHYKTNNQHEDLSKFIHKKMRKIPWIITYDKAEIVKKLYSDLNMKEFNLVHNAGGSKKGIEIVISNRSLEGWS